MMTQTIDLQNNPKFWQLYKQDKIIFDRDPEINYKQNARYLREILKLKALRGTVKTEVYHQLKTIGNAVLDKREHRDRLKPWSYEELAEVYNRKLMTAINKGETRTIAKVRSFYEHNYRLAASTWAGGETDVKVYLYNTPDASAYTQKVWSKNGKWSGNDLFVSLNVSRNWLKKVYLEGIALCDGLLTTHAKKITEVSNSSQSVYDATWVVQSRGYSIRLETGIILFHHQQQIAFHGKNLKLAEKYRDKYLKSLQEQQINKHLNWDELINKYKDLKLSRSLSKLAGNCESGTSGWLAKHGFSDRKTITIREALLADPTNERVLLVIKKAIAKHLIT